MFANKNYGDNKFQKLAVSLKKKEAEVSQEEPGWKGR